MSLESHDDLVRQAERHGVALRYHSFWGEDKQVAPEVLEQALTSMGLHQAPPSTDESLPPVHVTLEGDPIRLGWRSGSTVTGWRLAPEQESAAGYSGTVERHGDHWIVDLPPTL